MLSDAAERSRELKEGEELTIRCSDSHRSLFEATFHLISLNM